MSGEGSGSKPRGFILAPSRLARPPPSEETDKNATSAAKPLFSGFKASKLKPSGGAIHAVANNSAATDAADTKVEEKTEEAPAAEKGVFSFTPLSKEIKKAENGEKEEAVVENGGGAFVFGQKLGSRVENVATGGAVFGEHLSERVVGTPAKPTKSALGSVSSVFGENLSDAKDPAVDDVNSPQKKNMLFSTAATATLGKEMANKQDVESSKKSLSEAAAEYTESHSNKRKYDEVAVVTGEEEEENVLKMNVKLNLFSGGTWKERGRGMLRLNDDPVSTPGHLKSRLVMRTGLGQVPKVVLNTKLWPEMECKRRDKKSLDISAMDEGEVRVFCISASCEEERNELFTALESRLNQLKTDKAESTEPPEKKASLGD